jgi:hypothetical protein
MQKGSSSFRCSTPGATAGPRCGRSPTEPRRRFEGLPSVRRPSVHAAAGSGDPRRTCTAGQASSGTQSWPALVFLPHVFYSSGLNGRWGTGVGALRQVLARCRCHPAIVGSPGHFLAANRPTVRDCESIKPNAKRPQSVVAKPQAAYHPLWRMRAFANTFATSYHPKSPNPSTP